MSHEQHDRDPGAHSHHAGHGGYVPNSLTLLGSIAMGTGVMIGAGIFALTGQVAELAGGLFPLAFVCAAVVAAFSAYSYVRVTHKYPSAGGIAMILDKAYGRTTVTAGSALLMYFSMVISESLVARTFATYTLRIFGRGSNSWLVPALGVGLVLVAFAINLLRNQVIGGLSKVTAFIKVGGIAILAGVGLWLSRGSFESLSSAGAETSAGGFLAAVALAILAYKGFTTITNSGAELVEPKKNIGRSITVSLAICAVLYIAVALAVAGNLSIAEVVASRDSALAAAARPALGNWGEWSTIGLAIVATFSGIIASMFAASRMLAMVSEMGIVPHSHFGMPGRIQKHTLVYTAVIALGLTVFLDLGRIASLGAIFYIVMDMVIHWGVLTRLRRDVGASPVVVLAALALDAAVLAAFLYIKAVSDPLVLFVSLGGILLIYGGEWFFLKRKRSADGARE